MHINGNSLDNRAINLKWGTHKENCNEPDFIESTRRARINKKEVVQFTLDGIEVARHESIAAAGRAVGVHFMSISRCLNHSDERKTAGGFKWKFVKEL